MHIYIYKMYISYILLDAWRHGHLSFPPSDGPRRSDHQKESKHEPIPKLERPPSGRRRFKVYCCDVRASNRKGACEKNHVEVRELLPKGKGIRFDRLGEADCAHLMSRVNSSPRPSLSGLSPIFILKAAFKGLAEALLDAPGIEELPADELGLTGRALNRNRRRLGKEPLV